MEERRKVERLPMLLPVRWETASGVYTGVIVNGSTVGCFVQSRAEDPSDDPLRLEIQLPDGERLYLWGEVMYYLPTEGFGLQFIAFPDGGSLRNEMWLDYLSLVKTRPSNQCEDRLVTA